jgi:hypothetical protein
MCCDSWMVKSVLIAKYLCCMHFYRFVFRLSQDVQNSCQNFKHFFSAKYQFRYAVESAILH